VAKNELIKHDFKSEADLCTMLSERARDQGWRVFPETADHDLLLVATAEVKTFNARAGDQIGVQAKLHPNIEVVAQAMPHGWREKGPHFHAVLVPVAVKEFDLVANRCGILVMEATRRVWRDGRLRRERYIDHELRYLPPSLRHYYDEMDWHPDVEILVPAGVRSPKRITPWKVDAVRLCLETLRRGFITTADFRKAGVSMTVWRQKKWIESTGERIGRSMKYRLVLENKPPHLAWPEIAERLGEDANLDEQLNKRQQKRIGSTR
jgi:hypothetical protein